MWSGSWTLEALVLIHEPGVPAVTEPADQRDSFLAELLAAPEGDEPLSDAAREAIRDGEADVEAGRIHSMEDLEREFGTEPARPGAGTA